MASPFAVFRRNQQKLLVVLIIFSIFAFTLSGLFQSEGINLPFLGLILGTCLMTAIGVIINKPARLAGAGAVGGLVAGVIAGVVFQPSIQGAVAQTSLGAVTPQEQVAIRNDRNISGQFMAMAIQEALGPQAVRQRLPQFGFGLGGRTEEEEDILTIIMKKEAQELGISVDPEAVSNYIDQATDEKLSKKAYEEILDYLRLTDSEVYRILGEQLAIKTARLQTGPQAVMTPQKYWDYYGKMQFSQTIQSVSIPVDTFIDQVAKPKTEELKAFFEAHKTNFPSFPSPESVGFRQPRKIQLAYIESAFLDIEQSIPEITDKEIETYYEDNKDELYLNKRVPDLDLNMGSGAGGTAAPDLFDPNLPSPKIDLDNPGKPTPDETPEKKKEETPKSEAKPEPEKADEEKPADSPKTESAEEKKPSTENGEKPEGEEKAPEQFALTSTNSILQTVAFQEEEAPADKKPADKTSTEEKPAETKPEVEKPAEKKPETPPKPEEKPESKPESKQPESTVPPAPQTGSDGPLDAEKPGEKAPKYRPLDDFLRDEIRDRLLDTRTREKQRELAEEVSLIMSGLAEQYILLNEEFLESSDKDKQKKLDAARDKFALDTNKLLAKLAEEKGLHYEVTTEISQQDLALSNEYSIGTATLGMDPSTQQQQSVAGYVFNLTPDDIYNPKEARSLDPDKIYVYWKTRDEPSRVPAFDDEGIEAQVLEAWKQMKAKPLAEKRAKELANQLGKAESTWSEQLLEETITGEKEGVLMNPPLIEDFSWMRTSSAPGPMGFPSQIPEMTTLSTIDTAGEKFMEAVFTQIEVGEVGVVVNDDESAYYVVEVRERRPANPAELSVQREQFLRTDMFTSQIGFENGQIKFPSPYIYLVGGERQELNRLWLESLFKRYEVKFLEPKESENL
ncbi:hypothetical protein OAK91_04000 [Planctomycetaceae bacterium]|nr:hypothetical protein [Planctomycetaceae bacterium]